METSTSTSPKPQPKTNANEDIAIEFGGSCLSNNNVVSTAAAIPESSDSHSPQHVDQVIEETEGSAPIFDSWRFIDQEVIGATEWPFTSLNPDKNIWACPSFFNGRNSPPENLLSDKQSSMNFQPLDNVYGSLRYQTSVNSFVPNSSSNQFRGNLGLNYPSSQGTDLMNGAENFSPVMENPFVNDLILEYGSSQILSSLEGFDFLAMATSRDGSEQLRRVLEQGNSSYIHETLKGVSPSIFQLMIDPHGRRVFELLVDKCEDCGVYAIVMKVQGESDKFLAAAFCKLGSLSIQRLIKRVKKTEFESVITEILSSRSYDLMTDKIGSHVIKQCFMVFGKQANQVIYDKILSHFQKLATDPVGCISVNDCIDNIIGPQRKTLLNLVGFYAIYLSNDPSGNFVVQHVLELKNYWVTQAICYCLKGEYVNLAQKKCGSHVVEKCLKSSFVGLTLVVQELLDNDKVLFMLAQHQYGNYVLQTALKLAKLYAEDLYQALVKALEPNCSNLPQKTRAKYVTNLINDLESQRAKPN